MDDRYCNRLPTPSILIATRNTKSHKALPH
jgi:hypothetical protein